MIIDDLKRGIYSEIQLSGGNKKDYKKTWATSLSSGLEGQAKLASRCILAEGPVRPLVSRVLVALF